MIRKRKGIEMLCNIFFSETIICICIHYLCRSSTAPHRSLPDIPISEPQAGDTGSDLYATVGDKVAEKPQGRSRNENHFSDTILTI